MATRFYYTYDGPDLPVSTAGDHPWTSGPAVGAGHGFELTLAKSDRYATMKPLTATIPAGTVSALLGIWYSPPLAVQTFSGTVSGMALLTVAPAGIRPDMRIALVRTDGSVRTWLYTGAAATTGGSDQFPPPPTVGGTISLPTVSTQPGDRLRVEIGVFGSSTAGGNVAVEVTAQIGADLTPLMSIADVQGYSLTPDPDPAHPGVLLLGAGTSTLTADSAHPGLYLIGP